MNERAQRNIAAVRAFYRQEQEYAASDIVWHVPGHNPVSGEYRGWDAYFTTMVSRMQPLDRWEVEVDDVMVNGDFVTATFRVLGERRRHRVELWGVHLFRLNDAGQVVEGWGFVNDQDALDAFFSA
jgi:hypothetical protein